ncbi:hypothetical protein BWI96_16760 [Siphonobacter sp. SORGH_AS_0500]|uniref:hypothetical protein n=1 Tax=Siphonobacter sp. SORGH_AS_0500 TaxID=1864824 RepID=UPI000CAFB743|nr:hypothetical protein [Siphonobacter sp. SORGH_AS_0500]PKK35550.1 hypothetical protein BWI96_16760 [Siphonobacter sp. SORGH_AS_0500]
MDLKPVIDAWLSRPVFATGRELYFRYGSSESYKRLFARRDDQGAFQVLITAIQELRENLPFESVESKRPEGKPALKPSEFEDAPEAVQAFITQRKAYWAEVVSLKKLLRTSESQSERGEAAFRILQLRTLINRIWQQTDYYDRTGQLLEVEKEEPLDAELSKLDDLTLKTTFQNNQKYLSKYAKRDRSQTVEAEYQRRLAQQPQIEQILKERKESKTLEF